MIKNELAKETIIPVSQGSGCFTSSWSISWGERQRSFSKY